MWTQKYQPTNFDEFNGSPKTVEYLKTWDGKPLILYGPSGSGKTILSKLTEKFHDWNLIEVTNDNLKQALELSITQNIFGGKKLILIEDVNEFRDISKIKELVEKTKNPLLLTTRDFTSKKLTTLKKSCGSLQIRRPMASTITNYLAKILVKEKIECDKELLTQISKNAAGDYRAALNDLESISCGKTKITPEDLELIPDRDRKKDVYACLSEIFGGRDLKKVSESTWNLDMQPRDILFWIDENMPKLYTDKDSRLKSLEKISRADIYLGRIMSRQYWGFLRYVSTLMTAGVNLGRPEKVNYTQYGFPKFWMNMSRTKTQRNIENTISEKLSPILHVSKKTAVREYIPLIQTLVKNKKIDKKILDEYGLEKAEQDYLS